MTFTRPRKVKICYQIFLSLCSFGIDAVVIVAKVISHKDQTWPYVMHVTLDPWLDHFFLVCSEKIGEPGD